MEWYSDSPTKIHKYIRGDDLDFYGSLKDSKTRRIVNSTTKSEYPLLHPYFAGTGLPGVLECFAQKHLASRGPSLLDDRGD